MKKTILIVTLCLTTLFTVGRKEFVELCGVATYYARKFNGRHTANGEIYRASALTAASNVFNFNTKVKVTNLKNGKSVVVRINDRMGNKHRLIDLSPWAAKRLGFFGKMMTRVRVETLDSL